MTRSATIAIAAGGTGGHMVPAATLATELARRGHDLFLITDARGRAFAQYFSGTDVAEIPSGSPSRGSLRHRFGVLRQLLQGRATAKTLLEGRNPRLLVGFGGYPALPSVWAAKSLGLPYAIHEQNAILGRVNRLVAGRAAAVALSFDDTARVPARAARKVRVTGNPIRPDVAVIGEVPYTPPGENGIFRLMVTGGSQGARILSDVVPAALSLLPRAQRDRLQVTQQCRPEDLDRVAARYRESGIAAQTMSFIDDLPERLMWSHLVISRAGATTVAELTAAGRPAILVPLPSATDDHQTANTTKLVSVGGAWVVAEPDFSAPNLAKRMKKLMEQPERLVQAAAASLGEGRPRAARDLADLVESLAGLAARESDAVPESKPPKNTSFAERIMA